MRHSDLSPLTRNTNTHTHVFLLPTKPVNMTNLKPSTSHADTPSTHPPPYTHHSDTPVCHCRREYGISARGTSDCEKLSQRPADYFGLARKAFTIALTPPPPFCQFKPRFCVLSSLSQSPLYWQEILCCPSLDCRVPRRLACLENGLHGNESYTM